MSIDYSSKQVWEARFAKYPDTFEWLGSSDNLLPHIAAALEKSTGVGDDKRILHIGCGTSKLGFALRDALKIPPRNIINLDYAQRAIELGREHESQLSPGSGSSMHWVCGDLLDWDNLNLACAKFAPFSLVLDKSTSDALACGLDVDAALPFLPGRPAAELGPLPLLALHLAALVRPGAYWVAMSYSATRFDFLDDGLPLDIPGVLTPGALWAVERVEEVEAFQQPVNGAEHVHRPPVLNQIYILRRTDTPLEIWPSSEF